MAGTWNTEQATALAPDDASLKAARGLASPRKWTLLGQDEGFLWGLAQGSGKEPYQVQVDLSEPAFKCSCPSHKFPCKHGLGLLLIFCEQPQALARQSQPPWVADWAAKRAEKKVKKETREEKAPDPEAQAKRLEKRENRMDAGVEYLQGWLEDVVRHGLAVIAEKGYAFWEESARRLVDAQAPGLARWLRELGGLTSGNEGWEALLLDGLGRLQLLLEGWQRRGQWPAELDEELKAQLGLTVNQEELGQGAGASSRWLVLAQSLEEEERLITRITWLLSREGRSVKHFQFSYAGKAAASPFSFGRWFEGEVVLFPGCEPLRGLVKEPVHACAAWEPPPRLAGAAALLDRHAQALSRNPWLFKRPYLLEAVPVFTGQRLFLADAGGQAVPCSARYPKAWELVSLGGGAPIGVFGEWNGAWFEPLSAVTATEVIPLVERNA